MKAGMDGMQQMQISGDTDKDFTMMMKIHHQPASREQLGFSLPGSARRCAPVGLR